MNASKFNQLQKLVINWANENGIILADTFKTVDQFKTFIVAIAFKGLVDAGLSVQKSYDTVFGEGQFDELYHKLRAASVQK